MEKKYIINIMEFLYFLGTKGLLKKGGR